MLSVLTIDYITSMTLMDSGYNILKFPVCQEIGYLKLVSKDFDSVMFQTVVSYFAVELLYFQE